MLLPFLVAIVFTGVYPKPLLDRIEPSVERSSATWPRTATSTPIPTTRRSSACLTTRTVTIGWRGHGRRGAMTTRAMTTRRVRADERARSTDPILNPNIGPEIWWFALSPLLVLVGGALALMLARRPDAEVAEGSVRLRVRNDRGRSRRPGDLQLGRHHRQRADDARRRRTRIRHVRDVVDDHDLRRRDPRLDADRRVHPGHSQRRPRGLRPVPRGGDRWHRDGVGERSHRAVPRSRDAVAGAVRARGVEPTQRCVG